MHLVGFQDAQRKRLASFQNNSSAIALEHYKIKRARDSDEIEVLLKPSTTVGKSPRKFNASSKEDYASMVLKDLESQPI